MILAGAVTSVYGVGPAASSAARTGEVIGNNVYVRSGPSLNHYPICKLSAGDPVTVVGERGDWYEILPPAGTFSLVSGDYVDTADQKSGVINGNRVRVRAGSKLNDNMYTVQTMLSKGTEVTILGKNANGFLRIEPPAGATLWISRKFVELASTPRRAQANRKKTESTTASAMPASASSAGKPTPAKGGDSSGAGATLAGVDLSTEARKTLKAIEESIRKELAKPLLERNMKEIVQRLEPIAQQKDDEFARRYAQARLEQIHDMERVAEAVRKIHRLDEEAQAKRREYLDARSRLPALAPSKPAALDAQGELRESALYPPGSVPRRFRLVDPAGVTPRTIGYVEIPPHSSISVDHYLGQYVGVRASSKHLQKGAVDAVPIYVATELVLLHPPERQASKDSAG